MPVVSNSSPLISFAKIGRLSLLETLFGQVLIPPAVYEEVTVAGASYPGAAAIMQATWIQVTAFRSSEYAIALAARLDAGEAAAIALALDLKQTDVLLDDQSGRRAAHAYGLQPIGSAGILVLAKQQGHLSQVRPLLEELRAVGLYLSDAIFQEILRIVGE